MLPEKLAKRRTIVLECGLSLSNLVRLQTPSAARWALTESSAVTPLLAMDSVYFLVPLVTILKNALSILSRYSFGNPSLGSGSIMRRGKPGWFTRETGCAKPGHHKAFLFLGNITYGLVPY